MSFIEGISKVLMVTHYKQDTKTKIAAVLRYLFAITIIIWITAATIYIIL